MNKKFLVVKASAENVEVTRYTVYRAYPSKLQAKLITGIKNKIALLNKEIYDTYFVYAE